MANLFASRMVELRTQRGVSQKDASEALGISQALLSHYEKGIRECGLDFLLKAAAYYDVSCDYLLGRVDTRRNFHEKFEDGDIEFDSEFKTSTILRAATMLHDHLAEVEATHGNNSKNYYSLSIYQLILNSIKAGYLPKSWISLPIDSALALCNAKAETIERNLTSEQAPKHSKSITEPMCIKTVISASERLILKEAESLVNSTKA